MKKKLALLVSCAALVSTLPAADDVLITEFMAANGSTLADEDGAFPDWIEIYNAGTNVVNLGGWFLTDSSANLRKWPFPPTNLTAQAYLIVFASGKDRRVPGAPLHTSFNLSASGEYLALVRPDGTNIASAYAPLFPPQASDTSFGIVTASPAFSLLSTSALARVHVPLDGSLGTGWTVRTFDDSGWSAGTNGLGFDVRSVQVLSDDFSVSRDYLAGNFSGSIWSGFQRGGDTVVTAANANTTNPGRLTLGSRLGNWENGDNDGMLLYVAGVTNDFTADVEIPVSDNPQYHSIGLMARVADLNAAGPGEDWVAAMMFDQFSVGTTVRSTDNGVSTTPATGVTHRFMRLQRAGNVFTVLSKAVAGEAYSVRASSTRLDLEGIPLQVGVWQATYSANTGTAQLDNFRLTLGAADGAVTYDGLVKTDLAAAMLGANNAGLNSSAYVRLPFVVTNAADLGQLTLRMRYDDGFVAFLNGVEVARRNAPASPAWNSAATAERAKPAAIAAETIDLGAFLPLLVNGANVLAIHGLNATAADPDFLLLAELETSARVVVQPDRWRYFVAPTPGQPNGLGRTTLGAVVNTVEHRPAAPTDGDNLIITARVRPTFDAVTNVTLHYRVMWSNEVTVAMFDDGGHSDGAAGDGLFGATIPAGASTPRQMVRWFVTATDTSGTESRWPLFENPASSPEYFGTVIADPGITTQLPVFQYFVEKTNWYKLPNNGPYDKNTTNGSVFYLGRFYDNVRVRIRGASSVFWKFPKQSMHFDFHPENRFYYADDRALQDEININALWVDKGYVRNNLSMQEVYRAAGVIFQDTFFVLAYFNSGLHSVATFIEEPDQQYLSRHGLDPEGAYYKMYNPLTDALPRPPFVAGANPDNTQGVEKRTRQLENNADLQAIVEGVKAANPNRAAFVFDNFDVPQVINYFAASVMIQDWDRYPKNTFMYRDTLGTRLWQIHPWDADLSWGYNGWQTDEIIANHPTMSHPFYGDFQHGGTYGGTHVLNDAFYKTPALRDMFLRRLRTLLEQILQAPGTPASQLKLDARLDAYSALMGAEAELDKQRWGLPFGTNQTFAQAIGVLKNAYIAPRRTNLFVTYGGPGGLIPPTQFRYPALEFGALEVNPISGNQAQEYLCLTNANNYAVDVSGWRLEGGVQFTFKPGTVIPSNSVVYLSPDVVAFRARTTGPRGGQGLFVLGNYQGQLSARGEPLQLIDDRGRSVRAITYPGAPSLAQQFLRVTEIHYNPAPLAGNTNDAQQFEFIELKNISTTQTLNLGGVRLANGVDFAFTGSAITSLAPGATVVVVRNPAAFLARYGAGAQVAGTFTGSLENDGERIVLLDAAGEEILDFTYADRWYPITDGLGFSLVVVEGGAEPDAWSQRTHWRPSARTDGSPAGLEPAPAVLAPIVINEVLSRTDLPLPTDSVELHNPTAGAADISGWFLTDDFNTPNKFRIPDGTVLPAGSHRVFTEADFNPVPGVPPSFSFSSLGDEAYLFSADANGRLTGWVHGFRYGAADNGVSFGRHVTSDGAEHFVAQTAVTLGAANAGPRVGPIVINEILYRPADKGGTDNAADEFIELLNSSAQAVSLFDPANPARTWTLSGGIEYVFPAGQTLAPGGFVLVVNFDPATNAVTLAAFRGRFALPSGVPILGPYGSKLDNAGERIELNRPGTPEPGAGAGTGPDVLVDAVDYRDAAPWPAGADGFGLSLQRRTPSAFGNEPANWIAAPPGAGVGTPNGVPPVITAQPVSQTFIAFNDVMLSVGASGAAPLGYQWRLNGANLPGATNSLLPLNNLQPHQAGDYGVVVYNAAGSIVSSNASIRINIAAVITQPPASVYVRPGSNAIFTVAAVTISGTSLAYQWRFNGNNLPGATAASLTVSNVSAASEGLYSVVVTDSVGSATTTPAALGLLINPKILQPPLGQSVVVGSRVTLSVGVSGSPLPMTYEWRRGSTPLITNVVHSLTDFYTFIAPTVVTSQQYRIIVRNLAYAGNNTNVLFTVSTLADADGDGIPDVYEAAYGVGGQLSPLADDDGDGMSNGAEYTAGTDPTNPLSYLRVERIVGGPGASASTMLEFQAVSNRTYTVQYQDEVAGTGWQTLGAVVARAMNRTEVITDGSPGHARRFYRLATPALAP